MKIVSIENGSICEFDGCDKLATDIASGRGRYLGVHVYCETHASMVEDDNYPEYTVSCPNCERRFGVN